jgi:hypothetical protein
MDEYNAEKFPFVRELQKETDIRIGFLFRHDISHTALLSWGLV